MFIFGQFMRFIEVVIDMALYYHNDFCKVCPEGQIDPHTECKSVKTTYRIGAYTYAYEYVTCQSINGCGVNQCDTKDNVST